MDDRRPGRLPPHFFAAGPAVVNMIRQIGWTVGVAVLVVVLGSAGDAPGRCWPYTGGSGSLQ